MGRKDQAVAWNMFSQESYAKIIGHILVLLLVLSGVVLWYSGTKKIQKDEILDIVSENHPQISVLITPHHLLAQEQIRAAFEEINSQVNGSTVKRIFLISPNHFNIGGEWVIGSEEDWEVPGGTIQAERAVTKNLKKIVRFGNGILEREHGIRNLLPFVKEYFPHASLVSLAIRDGIPERVSDALAQTLYHFSENHTLLIVSADFSHYLDWNFSRFHDDLSLRNLQNMDMSMDESLDVDCAGCLRIAQQYAQLRATQNFHLISRSSSLEMVGKNLVGEETSHITGYFSSLAGSKSDEGVHLLFSGLVSPDMMSSNARRIFMSQDKNIFERNGRDVENVFQTVPYSVKQDILNDRSLDYSSDGFSETTIHGQKITYVEAKTTDVEGADREKERIRAAKEAASFVIVLLKNTNTMVKKSERMKKAQSFIDAGADLIIGVREDEIQPLEIYKGKVILWSLGNITRTCVQARLLCEGIMVGLGIRAERLELVIMPVKSLLGSVEFASGSFRKNTLLELSRDISDEKLKTDLGDGHLYLEVRKES